MQNISDYSKKNTIVAIVGNKIDLENRNIKIDEAKNLSDSLKVDYFECSAKDNIGFRTCVVDTLAKITKSQRRIHFRNRL